MRSRYALWSAFIAAHALAALLALTAPGLPLGDVTFVYREWVGQAIHQDMIVGITEPWVYPILALVPMLAAAVFGLDHFGVTWLILVSALDMVAFAVLIRGGRRRRIAAWWWTAFIVCLGPIALARIDAVTVPLSVLGVLLALRAPAVAGALLAAATWMKVWPAALIGALVITVKARWRIVMAGVAVTVAAAGGALALGSGMNVLSFLTEQTGRGLQVEAPLSTIYLWQAALGAPGAFIYYDRTILTFQVTGTQVDVVIALATPLLAASVLAVCLTGLRAVKAGAPRAQTIPTLMLALVTALIVFNKVGSPQFMVWLVAPVIAGVVLRGRDFFIPALVALGVACLTQLVYPYLYWTLLNAWLPMVIVLTVRNIGTILIFAWSVTRLWRAGSEAYRRSAGWHASLERRGI